MAHSIVLLTFVACDHAEAIAFFIDALRFPLVEDTHLVGGKRCDHGASGVKGYGPNAG